MLFYPYILLDPSNHITVAFGHPRASRGSASLVIRHGVAWAECTTADLLVFDNHTNEVIEGEGLTVV